MIWYQLFCTWHICRISCTVAKYDVRLSEYYAFNKECGCLFQFFSILVEPSMQPIWNMTVHYVSSNMYSRRIPLVSGITYCPEKNKTKTICPDRSIRGHKNWNICCKHETSRSYLVSGIMQCRCRNGQR